MNPIEASFIQLVWQQFWQCSILVLAVYLICKLIKFRRAHLTFLLWLLVLLKFMTPPLWTSSSGLFCWIQEPFHSEMRQELVNQKPQSLTRTESIQLMTGGDLRKLPDVEAKSSPFEVTIGDVNSNEKRDMQMDQGALIIKPAAIETERLSSGYALLDMGLIVWALIALIIMGVMGLRYWRCRQIIRCAGEEHHPELNQLLERLCKELKVKRHVSLLITKSRMGPAVMGLLRPKMILPEAITNEPSLKELEPILAHELIHIRRGDLWVGLLQLLASVVWWFNPLIWFTGRHLKFEIEQCCDEEVLAELKCDPGIYAKCLLEVLELKQSLKTVPVVPGVRPVEITSKRLERIMKLGQGCHKRTPWWCWMIFVGLMVVILPGAAFVVSAADEPKETAPESDIEKLKLPSEKQAGNVPQSLEPAQVHSVFDLPGMTRTYSIKELLARAREAVGAEKAVQFLLGQINTRMKELEIVLPVRGNSHYRSSMPLSFEGYKAFPLSLQELKAIKNERKQFRISFGGAIVIRNDRLIVWGKDPSYHKRVEQVLAELAESDLVQFNLTARFISVPKRVVDKFPVSYKKMKMFTLKQVMFGLYEDEKQIVTKEPETVQHRSMICDTLDAKDSHAFVQKLMVSNQTMVTHVPPIILENNRKVSVVRKREPIFEKRFAGAGQRFRLSDYGISLDVRPTFSERGIGNEQVMLDYKLTFSKVEGQGKLEKTNLRQGRERPELIELIKEQHFEDVTMIQPGQTLVVGGFKISESAYDSKLLLVLLDVKKVNLEQDKVMLGVGVNSDAGVTGQIVVDETGFQNGLTTRTYPVADLVVPIPRKFVGPGYQPVKPIQSKPPRFEPLIELIKQNVTPDEWSDHQRQSGNRGASSISPYKKTMSLVVRHTQRGHDEIAKLLAKMRAVQDLMLMIKVRFIAANDLQKWYEHWNKSNSADAKSLIEQLKTVDLNQGTIIDASQAELIKQLMRASGLVDICQPTIGMHFFNRQSGEFNFTESIQALTKSECRIQVRPVVQQDDQVQISMVINAESALDTLSHLKSMTVPKGKSMLVDITDQISGKEPSLLPYQLLSQTQKNGTKKQKRFFLLVTPSATSNVANEIRKELTTPRPKR